MLVRMLCSYHAEDRSVVSLPVVFCYVCTVRNCVPYLAFLSREIRRLSVKPLGLTCDNSGRGGVRGAKIGTGEVEKRAREHSERNKKTLKRSPLTENKVLLFFLFLSSQDIEGAREVRMGDR